MPAAILPRVFFPRFMSAPVPPFNDVSCFLRVIIALALVRDACESYRPITVWPFRHLRDAVRKFLPRNGECVLSLAESAASGSSFQRHIILILAR